MITSGQSKAARKELGLTQKEVSESIGICNTDISKFECGRLALGPKECSKLEAFYEECKIKRNKQTENSDDELPSVTIGGFAVPSTLSQEEVDFLKASYEENQELIEDTLHDEVERGFLGGITESALIRNLLAPMAENLVIIQTILGKTNINMNTEVNSSDVSADENVSTYRDLLEHLLATPYAPE